MSRNLLMVLGGAALLVLAYLVFSRNTPPVPTSVDPTETSELAENVVVVNLSDQNDSGETGTATLFEENGQVTVTLSMVGFPEDTPQPAHFHTGNCPDVGAVKYSLTNVVNGSSTTILDVTLAQLENELPLGLNVHKSVPEASVYTACGDLEF